MLSLHSEFKKNFCLLNVLKTSFDFAEELSDMRKQMKALEEKNVTYMKETMNLQEVDILKFDQNATHISIYISGKQPTYPSPKPTFCPKWELSVNVGLGEG